MDKIWIVEEYYGPEFQTIWDGFYTSKVSALVAVQETLFKRGIEGLAMTREGDNYTFTCREEMQGFDTICTIYCLYCQDEVLNDD